ncbi:hypothetical protein WT33_22600 [Burkholderia stagnalis]|nr:hypothetical protein WT33_22600 [Burkholderia stagnalis]
MPKFSQMRTMGGGRGGGGIVMGSAVTSSVGSTPLVISFRRIEHSDRVVPVVAMNDGRILFGSPVRQDVLLAAYRISFGDPARKVSPLTSGESRGAVLISLLVRQRGPVALSEFLVHPAISDLAIGRDLIVVDGANFLFSEHLAHRLRNTDGTPPPANAKVLNMRQWQLAVEDHQFGGWYRFAERPSVISTNGDGLDVQAQSSESRHVLFEFVRPADPGGTIKPKPERSVIVSDAPDILPEFGTLNDFLKTAAILRWGATAGAKWLNGKLEVKKFSDVRTVVFRNHAATFDSRGAVEIELHQVQAMTTAAMASVPKDKLADANLLKKAIARERKLKLLLREMEARGYSSEVIEKATDRAAKREFPEGVNPIRSAITEILRIDMSPSDFKQLQSQARCKNTDIDKICEMKSQILIDMFLQVEPWAHGLLVAGLID